MNEHDDDLSTEATICLKKRPNSIFDKFRVRLDQHIIKATNRRQDKEQSIMNEEMEESGLQLDGTSEMEQDNMRNLSTIKVLQKELRDAVDRNDELQQVIDSMREDMARRDEDVTRLKEAQREYRESQKSKLHDLESTLTAHIRESFNSVIESGEQSNGIAAIVHVASVIDEDTSNIRNVLWSQINEENLNDDEISEDKTTSDDGLDSIPDLDAHEFEWSEDSERIGSRSKKFTFNEEEFNHDDNVWDEVPEFPRLTVDIDDTVSDHITNYVSSEEVAEQESGGSEHMDSKVDERKEQSHEIVAISDSL